MDGPLSIWPGSRLLYFDLLSEPRYEDYDISYLTRNRFGFLGNGFTTREYNGGDLSYYLGTNTNPGALIPSKRISDRNGGNMTCTEAIHINGLKSNSKEQGALL